MSVILDALHKARGDKRKAKSEPQPHSVARVLEAGVAPVEIRGEGRERSGGRGWIAAFAVGFGLLCLLVLIGGGFFLLYDQVRRLEDKAGAGAVEAATSTIAAPGKTNDLVNTSPVDLPPPLPVEELPVEPPAAAAAPVAVTQAGAASATPQFKLGSIVCEAGECVAGLNGRSVRVGDEIRGYQVVHITETEVVLKSVAGNDVVRLSQFD